MISPIAMDLSVCVCVCVCLCLPVIIVRVGHTLAKITNVKITFVDFYICDRMVQLQLLHFVIVTFFLEIAFFIVISLKP